MTTLASLAIVLLLLDKPETLENHAGSSKSVYLAHRNDEERERGFCGCPYSPSDWPLDDDEPGAFNGKNRY